MILARLKILTLKVRITVFVMTAVLTNISIDEQKLTTRDNDGRLLPMNMLQQISKSWSVSFY